MKLKFYLATVFLATVFFFWFFLKNEKITLSYGGKEKEIHLNDNGLDFFLKTTSDSVGDFLSEAGLEISEQDEIFPSLETKIFSGTKVFIRRAKKVEIWADGKKIEKSVLGRDVKEILWESGISLSRLDKTEPEENSLIGEGEKITVIRINVEEVTKKEEIQFKTIIKEDKKLGWREKKIETPGEKGERETQYRITYKDGKEISKVKLSSQILREPISQVETQGTYVKTGKAVSGLGTWYAWKGGLFAASRTLPKGSFARVTNVSNGKTVIVQINDYGPHGKDRIIDLDKVAFAKIGNPGAGVINVKVEPILN